MNKILKNILLEKISDAIERIDELYEPFQEQLKGYWNLNNEKTDASEKAFDKYIKKFITISSTRLCYPPP